MKTFLGFVIGIVLGWAVGQAVKWFVRRREARRYPDAFTRAAEQAVQNAGYGRDVLGRPKHTKGP